MPRLILLFVLSVCIQLNSKIASAADDVTVLDSETNYILKDSSEFNRMNKKFSLVLDSSTGYFLGSALAGSYLINRNDWILLEIRGEKAILGQIFSSILGYTEDSRNDSFGINYKHFFSNSFFVRSGLSYHNLSNSRKYVGSVITSSDNFSFTGNRTNFLIGIGNDWQWDHFTLGFDWLRTNIPVACYISDESYNSNSKSQMESNEDIFFRMNLFSTSFHIGATF